MISTLGHELVLAEQMAEDRVLFTENRNADLANLVDNLRSEVLQLKRTLGDEKEGRLATLEELRIEKEKVAELRKDLPGRRPKIDLPLVLIENRPSSWVLSVGKREHGFVGADMAEELRDVYSKAGYSVGFKEWTPVGKVGGLAGDIA
jgi:hypothetical protein